MKIYIDLRFQFLKALRILFITIFKTHFEPGLTCDSFCLMRSHIFTSKNLCSTFLHSHYTSTMQKQLHYFFKVTVYFSGVAWNSHTAILQKGSRKVTPKYLHSSYFYICVAIQQSQSESGALIVRYRQKKEFVSFVLYNYYCSENHSIAHNLGTTGGIFSRMYLFK